MFNSGNATPFTMPVQPAGYSNCGNNGGFGGWGDGWWAIIIFAMIFGWGNGGWGGGFGGNGAGLNGALTRADLCQDMNFNNLESAVRGVQQGICDSTFALNNTITNGFAGVDNAVCTLGYQTAQGFHGVDNAICNLGYNVQQGFNATNVALMQGQNALSTQIADCCCKTQNGLKDIQFQNAQDTCAVTNTIQNTTRDIIDNQNANSRQILDFLVQDKISTLQAENQSLRLAASQTAQNEYLVSQLKPCPVPAYVTCNPWASSYGIGLNNGCGCNTGCGCC